MSFRLQRPLDDSLLPHIAGAHSIYGIRSIRVVPDGVTVEYDATRLTPAEVQSALAAGGLPLQPA